MASGVRTVRQQVVSREAGGRIGADNPHSGQNSVSPHASIAPVSAMVAAMVSPTLTDAVGATGDGEVPMRAPQHVTILSPSIAQPVSPPMARVV